MGYNIAIDGPAGAGKSTIAKLVAKELSFIYVDTGAMYRGMAYACLKAGVDVEDEEAVSKKCQESTIEICYEEGEQIVLLNGENVNGYIRTPEVSAATSKIAVYSGVRARLLDLQKDLAKKQDVVMDGRDIGTIVLPQADLKIFLTASSAERARRRTKELLEKGQEADFEQIKKEIEERDQRDSNRKVSPLKQAEDAIFLDSSDLTIREVVEKILSLKK